ncbi:MAG: hypothetical protein CFH01_00424 [Alphaproteobacteria bacterium MarineAlpha2_Bin1]|nr:MAG: hypothetical protein CFH01_00424 [Alphaproteobacteria bacterium MarineAlpha2_Bin1]
MSVWIIISSITILTVLILIFPFIFYDYKKKNLNNENDYDINIYKDQLAEIEKDIYRGVLSKEEFESAKNEVSRRILSQEGTPKYDVKKDTNNSQKFQLISITCLSLLIPIISLNLYYFLGNPSLPNRPFIDSVSNNKSLPKNNSEGVSSIEDSIIQLKKRLSKNKNDRNGWLLLGRSYLVIREPDQAIMAFKKVIELEPRNKEVYSFIGEALVFKNQGFVNDEAINYFEIALKDDNKNPASRYYLSLAKSQRGNVDVAFSEWLELAKETPPDAPWYPLLQKQIEEAAIKLGVKLEDNNNFQKRAGPTQEDLQAAEEMSSDDRREMIKGMVNGLAEKLKNNPNDLNGWKMLARSYRVLGEIKKAEEAEKMIKKLENE